MEKRGKLFYLAACLMFLLFALPFVEGRILAGKLMTLFFTFVLISGVYAVSGTRRINIIISMSLGLPSVMLIWLDQLSPHPAIDVITLSLVVLFCLFTVFCMLRYLMRAKKVSADVLSGAVSTYLLFGISWAMIYALIELSAPNSFSVGSVFGSHALEKWATFNYYSFMTLTTVGYGDIIPVTTAAQSFAVLEAVTGVLFVALLVSRLVSMYVYQFSREEKESAGDNA